jgi:hypothetical protein
MLGLAGCVSLALFVDGEVLLVGLGVIAAGVVWFMIADRIRSRAD